MSGILYLLGLSEILREYAKMHATESLTPDSFLPVVIDFPIFDFVCKNIHFNFPTLADIIHTRRLFHIKIRNLYAKLIQKSDTQREKNWNGQIWKIKFRKAYGTSKE